MEMEKVFYIIEIGGIRRLLEKWIMTSNVVVSTKKGAKEKTRQRVEESAGDIKYTL